MNKSDEVQLVTVYLATRNSSGVVERVLRVLPDGYILGERHAGGGDSYYVPSGHTSELGTGRDWRIAHCFRSYDEAKADYIALETQRVQKAQAALKQIAA